MTEESVAVEGACLIAGAKTKGVGCAWSGATLWSRAAYHDRGGETSSGVVQRTMTKEATIVFGGMPCIGCAFFTKSRGIGCVGTGASLWSSVAWYDRQVSLVEYSSLL